MLMHRGVLPKLFDGTPVVEVEPQALEPPLSSIEIRKSELPSHNRDVGGAARFGDCGDEIDEFFEIFFCLFDGGVDRIDRGLLGVVGFPDCTISDAHVI